jgi:hypothetical protein
MMRSLGSRRTSKVCSSGLSVYLCMFICLCRVGQNIYIRCIKVFFAGFFHIHVYGVYYIRFWPKIMYVVVRMYFWV